MDVKNSFLSIKLSQKRKKNLSTAQNLQNLANCYQFLEGKHEKMENLYDFVSPKKQTQI